MRSHECGLVQRHSTTSPSMVRVSERLNAAPEWCAGARPAYALPRTRAAAASLEIMARVRAPPSVDCRSFPCRPSAPVSARRMAYPPRSRRYELPELVLPALIISRERRAHQLVEAAILPSCSQPGGHARPERA